MDSKKLFDTLQWSLIVISIIVITLLLVRGCSYEKEAEMIIDEYKQENNYLKVYSSQRISTLTKENKELADKVKKLENVETAVEIKYIYKVDIEDSTPTKVEPILTDSTPTNLYVFQGDDDTISYTLNINGEKVNWYSLNMKISDKLTLINQEHDGLSKLTVQPESSHMDIQDVDAWHRKEDSEKWYKRFTFGPQIGVGYGFINNKPDVFIGVSIGYNLKK